MPRDNKTALIQKIAKQACVTFRGLHKSGPEANGGNKSAGDHQGELVSLVTAVRAADLKIAPRKSRSGSGAAPVTYMHICETDVFSMGVFLLRSGASIPLHDHPGMNGMLKVLYGKVRVRCFDKLEGDVTDRVLPPFDPPLAPREPASVWRATLRSVAVHAEHGGPCLLTPARDNLHHIEAVDGPAAFLDILAPPYNPDDGRDCHYYKVLQAAAGGDTRGGKTSEGRPGEEEEEEEEEEEAWLLEIPQPEDFWCGGEPYPGPAVSV